MAHHAPKSFTREQVTLPQSSLFGKLPIIGLVLAVIGLALTFVLGASDKASMYTSYLVSFMYWLSIALGGYFFVVIFFLSRSAWNVGIRRIPENVMSTLPVFALLFIPLVFGAHDLYHWTHERVAGEDPILDWKQGYFETGFFYGRAVLYFVIWTVFSALFYRLSTKQDETGDTSITRRLQTLAAPAIAAGALSSTFAAFDWIMSADPHWFSTMFGVYFFAGCLVAIMAFICLVAIALRSTNATNGAITEEHLHGAGMLMFGFNIFWTYIAFSQFVLIWYANIPEETNWFAYRYTDGWENVSLLLLAGHFVLPFFFLMPRQAKRNPLTLGIGAAWLLVMHFVDLYWVIKPSVMHAHGVHGVGFNVVDVLAWVGIGGIFLAIFGYRMKTKALVPFRDPRLPESMKYSNM